MCALFLIAFTGCGSHSSSKEEDSDLQAQRIAGGTKIQFLNTGSPSDRYVCPFHVQGGVIPQRGALVYNFGELPTCAANCRNPWEGVTAYRQNYPCSAFRVVRW